MKVDGSSEWIFSKFRLKHIVSLDPLEFEDFDGKFEVGFVRFSGRKIP